MQELLPDMAISDWLPNHVLVVILTLVFSVLNPLLMPFAVLYFAIESGEEWTRSCEMALLICFL